MRQFSIHTLGNFIVSLIRNDCEAFTKDVSASGTTPIKDPLSRNSLDHATRTHAEDSDAQKTFNIMWPSLSETAKNSNQETTGRRASKAEYALGKDSKKKQKKKRITLTNVSTTTAAGAGSGNITSASDTSTSSLPPEGHGNLRMLSKFEQRLSFAENSQIIAKRIPNTLEDDNVPLAVEYTNERVSREALASSPSTAVSTSFTPVKLRIKRPPDSYSPSPSDQSEQSESPFERNLLSPSFENKRDGRKSTSPFEKNLLSPSFHRPDSIDSISVRGNLFNIGDFEVANPEAIASKSFGTSAMDTMSSFPQHNNQEKVTTNRPKCFRLGLLVAAFVYNGVVVDVPAEIYFLFRLLKVDNDYVEFSSGVTAFGKGIFTSNEAMQYYAGACLWGLRSILFRSGTYILKQIGSNQTVKMHFRLLRDSIRSKLENVGMGKISSKVPVGSNTNQNYIWWASVNSKFRRDDYNSGERAINQNRIDTVDFFDQLYRQFEKQNRNFYDADWNKRFPDSCRSA